jgi:hypothetical protein
MATNNTTVPAERSVTQLILGTILTDYPEQVERGEKEIRNLLFGTDYTTLTDIALDECYKDDVRGIAAKLFVEWAMGKSEMPGDRLVLLSSLLSCPAPLVRLGVVLGLENLEGNTLAEDLLSDLAHDESLSVRSHARDIKGTFCPECEAEKDKSKQYCPECTALSERMQNRSICSLTKEERGSIKERREKNLSE